MLDLVFGMSTRGRSLLGEQVGIISVVRSKLLLYQYNFISSSYMK
jgi:hypothetical protein